MIHNQLKDKKMKLFAVIYSIGGFAREDVATPSIAGIFSDEKIADTVRKAAGLGAKVLTVELDNIAPGYLDFAKQALNIDLNQIQQDKKLGMTEISEFDLECLMTAEEFEQDADCGCITSDDGSGYWATDKKVSRISCWSSQPEWATHVCWYNK